VKSRDMSKDIQSKTRMEKALSFLTTLLLILSSLMILTTLSINCVGVETEAEASSYPIGNWWK